MAEGKKKIVIYSDWRENFTELTNEELGILMRHFFDYINDLNPVLEDRLLKIAWKPIEATLKRDLKKWEEKADERSKKARTAGLASAKARRLKKELNSTTELNELKNQLNPTKSTVSVSDSVNVNVSTNVDDDIYINNDKNLNEYLGNEKLCQAMIKNPENKITSTDALKNRLEEFNKHCSQNNQHSKTRSDYVQHFRFWNLKNLKNKKEDGYFSVED